MARYRNALPQSTDGVAMLTDGGLETSLIFQDGIELPFNAACELLRSEHGMRVLLDHFDETAAVAQEAGVGFSVDSPTWRANPDWTDRLGYSPEEFTEVNREGVRMAEEVRRRHESPTTPVVIAGVIGPRSDGYTERARQSAAQAAEYHFRQVSVLADTEADYITALSVTYSDEAVGMAHAAEATGMPIVISFTVETDGRLAGGESLEQAITAVERSTDCYPEYYMIDCAHPTHLPAALNDDVPWARRIRGYRANSTARSHRELNNALDLEPGDPHELAAQVKELRRRMPQLSVVGGCCGADVRHARALAAALIESPHVAPLR